MFLGRRCSRSEGCSGTDRVRQRRSAGDASGNACGRSTPSITTVTVHESNNPLNAKPIAANQDSWPRQVLIDDKATSARTSISQRAAPGVLPSAATASAADRRSRRRIRAHLRCYSGDRRRRRTSATRRRGDVSAQKYLTWFSAGRISARVAVESERRSDAERRLAAGSDYPYLSEFLAGLRACSCRTWRRGRSSKLVTASLSELDAAMPRARTIPHATVGVFGTKQNVSPAAL